MRNTHWALQYLEKARTAIFEVEKMAPISKIGSRRQVATTDPKCDTIRPAKPFAPPVFNKNCLRDRSGYSYGTRIQTFVCNSYGIRTAHV